MIYKMALCSFVAQTIEGFRREQLDRYGISMNDTVTAHDIIDDYFPLEVITTIEAMETPEELHGYFIKGFNFPSRLCREVQDIINSERSMVIKKRDIMSLLVLDILGNSKFTNDDSMSEFEDSY